MDTINTNINDYNYDELIQILNMSDDIFDINDLFRNIINKIDIIELPNKLTDIEKKKISLFYKNIFYKICHHKLWNPSKQINKYFSVFDYKLDSKENEISIEEIKNFINELSLQNNVNPLTPSCIKQIISIDSIYRDNYETTSSSDFTITLPIEYTNVIQMKLSSAEIPNTYYLFDPELKNNIFVIKIYENNEIKKELKIIIPIGSWYADDMISYLTSLLDDNENDYVRCLYFGINMNSGKSFFRLKMKNEITLLNNPIPDTIDITKLSYSLSLSEEQSDYNNSAIYLFGFPRSVIDKRIFFDNTYDYGNLVYNAYQESKYIFGFNFNNYFYLSVEDFVGNKKEQIVGIKNKSYIGKNILARIQVSNPLFSVITDNNEDNTFKKRNYFGDVKIRKLKIQLLDRHGNIVNLNHSEISISIELTQRYNSSQYNTFNRILEQSNSLLFNN